MLILHGALCGEDLLLWGEVPAEATGARRPRGAGRVARREPRRHPHAADVALLEGRVAALGFDTARPASDEAVLWAPTVDQTPVASSALISPPPHDAATSVLPWTLSTARLSWPTLLPTLQSAVERPVLAPGIVAGPDLTFWGHATRFALALVAQGRFLPWVVERADGRGEMPAPRRPVRGRGATKARPSVSTLARWQPLLAGEDLMRVQTLAAVMPDACRAISRDASSPPDEAPLHLLVRFVALMADAIVREAAQHPDARDPGADHGLAFSVHDAWLHALRAPDAAITGADVGGALPAQVAEWQRPTLATVASPYRLVFRLREPTPPADTASVAPEPGENTWRVEYIVQRADDPSLIVDARDIWASGSRARRLLERGADADARAYLLQALGQASRVAPDVLASLSAREPVGYALDVQGAYTFLSRDAWTLEQAGFGVQLPRWWTRKGGRAKLAARAHVKSPRMTSESGLSLDDLVHVRWEAALGDTPLSRTELELLSQAKVPLVQVRGQWVEVTAEDRARALALLRAKGDTALTAGDLLRIALGAAPVPGGAELAGVDASGWVRDLLAGLQSGASIATLPIPPGFVGTLRPYQERGTSWLAFLTRWSLGACLADDMGLGKTVQTLVALEAGRQPDAPHPVLLICPTSVVGNWEKEVAKFTPGMRVLIHHGQRRARRDDFRREAAAHDLVLSSYALLARDLETLSTVDWRAVVLDEAQNIKNPETRQARAARALRAGRRIALTGTPVENHVGDLWSIMEFLNPGVLGTQAEFKRRYFVPIQATRDPAAAEALKRATGPFILRRVKTDPDIAADLPDKLEMNVFCTLTREQASLYAAVVLDLERALKDKDGIERKGLVLASLTKLKQICNHPAQFLGESANLEGRSGKLARITEMLGEIVETSDRALIFTQYAGMGALLTAHLQETFGREVFFLHGGTPRAERDRLVQQFQSADGPPVFVLSLKAGGTGLNLTAANHVFLYDRWWNPAVENQAIDRAFRIGQQRHVQVHKFLCAGTLEERIDEMIERKKSVAAQTVGTGEAWLTELSTDDLRAAIALGKGAVVD